MATDTIRDYAFGFDFEDTVIVITGASRGLGYQMAAAFADHGATVVCSARTEDTLAQAVAKLSDRTRTGDVRAVPADIREESDVKALFETVEDAYGGADVLINNAGVNDAGLTGGEKPPVHEIPTWLWDTIMETNLRGAFLCTRAALPRMLERNRGIILHISSGMGREGRANRGAYVASKFGLEGLHKSLADELEGTDVDSIVLDPGGGVNTDGFSSHLNKSTRSERLDPDIVVEPALSLAAGKGVNGGRYIATEW